MNPGHDAAARFDGVSIALHWVTAGAVFGLFGLGFWMVDLDYYHAWYRRAPDLHRSIGLSLATIVVLRLIWLFWRSRPAPLDSHTRFERRLAPIVQLVLLVLLGVMFTSGYLISTAKGQGIEVWGAFTVPSLVTSDANLEDTAGVVHEWSAYTLVTLALLHALAAFKHHIVDRDDTLRRMLGFPGAAGSSKEYQP